MFVVLYVCLCVRMCVFVCVYICVYVCMLYIMFVLCILYVYIRGGSGRLRFAMSSSTLPGKQIMPRVDCYSL